MAQTFVIKLGGSIVSPSEDLVFDFNYLDKLRQVLEPNLERGDKFMFVLGGGSTMRRYRDLAMEAGLMDHEQLHWIGTTINVMHGEIVRAYWHDLCDDGVYKYEDYYNDEPLEIKKGIKVGGGGRPGHSGDVDAVRAAIKCGAQDIISLKNVDAVYSADPKKDPNAVRLESISWDQYLEVIGNPSEHKPGASYPIDPIAAREAAENNITFYICNGWDIENLSNILKGEAFFGTRVTNEQ